MSKYQKVVKTYHEFCEEYNLLINYISKQNISEETFTRANLFYKKFFIFFKTYNLSSNALNNISTYLQLYRLITSAYIIKLNISDFKTNLTLIIENVELKI